MLGVMLATLSYGEKHLVALFYLLLDFKNGEGNEENIFTLVASDGLCLLFSVLCRG